MSGPTRPHRPDRSAVFNLKMSHRPDRSAVFNLKMSIRPHRSAVFSLKQAHRPDRNAIFNRQQTIRRHRNAIFNRQRVIQWGRQRGRVCCTARTIRGSEANVRLSTVGLASCVIRCIQRDGLPRRPNGFSALDGAESVAQRPRPCPRRTMSSLRVSARAIRWFSHWIDDVFP